MRRQWPERSAVGLSRYIALSAAIYLHEALRALGYMLLCPLGIHTPFSPRHATFCRRCFQAIGR